MSAPKSDPDQTEPTPLQDALERRLEVPAGVGEPGTPELVAAYSTLLLYAGDMTGARIEELRLRDLLAQITARFAWPHPLRRSTDRSPELPAKTGVRLPAGRAQRRSDV